ncbi:MAG: HAD hydrolase family protein [Elusimicrobiaceae bacterium]|jgi:3-deoxy-D-manno-octulosonate 8-phosphate phosphatase (KDO 8-P phosphatase)|nr:HAD hydrolase family protein [Elusimicrobiaceae bacterium]MBT3954768.1 HAD hydrolase family protein [Elusimicrobiaceae bacterium]MBT4008248.1 HAD hydrolase family protein [Elusimicrobiaceae bacterium]MBT4402632.1 HAD hydrolase family protein [Elusimicrobiaceae bacterium]MBT4439832.1 HAD hydrolase family protein [Elusimicrobiaceae bacterium]
MATPKSIVARAKKIKLFLTDVDGVMTDGKLYFFPLKDGTFSELKSFNVEDGLGLLLLNSLGITTGMITGRKSATVKHRAEAMSVKYVFEGFLSKKEALENIMKREKVKASEICFIGDDLIDLPILKEVGFAIAVKNAVSELKKHSHYVTQKRGGEGAVREVAEIVLKSKGLWNKVVKNIADSKWNKGKKPKTIVVSAK